LAPFRRPRSGRVAKDGVRRRPCKPGFET
jgi:hypothetical protein